MRIWCWCDNLVKIKIWVWLCLSKSYWSKRINKKRKMRETKRICKNTKGQQIMEFQDPKIQIITLKLVQIWHQFSITNYIGDAVMWSLIAKYNSVMDLWFSLLESKSTMSCVSMKKSVIHWLSPTITKCNSFFEIGRPLQWMNLTMHQFSCRITKTSSLECNDPLCHFLDSILFHYLDLYYSFPKSLVTSWNWQFSYCALFLDFKANSLLWILY